MNQSSGTTYDMDGTDPGFALIVNGASSLSREYQGYALAPMWTMGLRHEVAGNTVTLSVIAADRVDFGLRAGLCARLAHPECAPVLEELAAIVAEAQRIRGAR